MGDNYRIACTYSYANTAIALDDIFVTIGESVPCLEGLQLRSKLHSTAVTATVIFDKRERLTV